MYILWIYQNKIKEKFKVFCNYLKINEKIFILIYKKKDYKEKSANIKRKKKGSILKKA